MAIVLPLRSGIRVQVLGFETAARHEHLAVQPVSAITTDHLRMHSHWHDQAPSVRAVTVAETTTGRRQKRTLPTTAGPDDPGSEGTSRVQRRIRFWLSGIHNVQ